MTATLLVAWGPGEVRGILIDAGSAVELRVERDDQDSLIGVRFAGRVDRVVPALGAAFIDIGLQTPAFLPLRRHGRSDLAEGATIIVVVNKDERGTKPPEVRRLRENDESLDKGPVPRRLDPPKSPIIRLLASLSNVPVDAIITNDAETMLAARGYLRAARPGLAGGLELQSGHDFLEAHGMADAFEKALACHVSLANGALLSFEHTAAGTMVDVDMAQASEAGGSMEQAILATNLIAADAVGRELRLRGISGAIIVDFISMTNNGQRQRVWDRLAHAVAGDSSPVELHGWTRLGHFELTRRRGRASIAEIMLRHDGPEATPMTIALEALARITFAPAQAGPITIQAGPEVSTLLEGSLREAFALATFRCGRRVILERRPRAGRVHVTIDGV